jgi:hypothetical protein
MDGGRRIVDGKRSPDGVKRIINGKGFWMAGGGLLMKKEVQIAGGGNSIVNGKEKSGWQGEDC